MPYSVQGKEGWLVVQTPFGKYAKVRKSRRNLIPPSWQVHKKGAMFYNSQGELLEMTHGLIEIISRKQASWYGSPMAHDFGTMIKYIKK
jgi:hypothetical protein